jgi:hypothetical protein
MKKIPPVKQIEMPKPRPRSLLTMEDMGMDHDIFMGYESRYVFNEIWIMICLL